MNKQIKIIRKPQDVLVIISLFIFALLLNYKYLNDYPSYVHTWAQADRYALARGFVDNNLNLFKPQTFLYNHEFPNSYKTNDNTRITAVDCPINDYIPAVFMKLFHSNSPIFFRLYVLIISVLGLFFLYKMMNLLNPQNSTLSLLVLFLATSSPVFVYYQCNFLSTMPCIGYALIGIYFYVKYLKDNKAKNFNLSLLFLTISALPRITFAIPLIAVLGIEFIRILAKDSKFKPKIISVLFSIIVILGNFFYNKYLNIYGSQFLSNIHPVTGIEEFKTLLQKIHDNWLFAYFTHLQYYLMIAVILAAVIFIILRKDFKSKAINIFGFYIILYIIGSLMVGLLMSRQFEHHDYYFLDIFYIPIILIICWFAAKIPEYGKKVDAAIMLLFIVCLFSFYKNAKNSQNYRHTLFDWDWAMKDYNAYIGSDKILDSLNISKDSKMLVFNAFAPNLPFILMDRTGFVLQIGYVECEPNGDYFEKMLTWDSDYVVYTNEFFLKKIYSIYPNLINKVRKIYDNGKITICEHFEDVSVTLSDYYGYRDSVPILSGYMTFDNEVKDSSWRNYSFNFDDAFSGKYSNKLDKDREFGITYSTAPIENLTDKDRKLFVSGYFKSDVNSNCLVVVTIEDEYKNMIYYYCEDIKGFFNSPDHWRNISKIIDIPKLDVKDCSFSLYLWNKDKEDIVYDDFSFELF